MPSLVGSEMCIRDRALVAAAVTAASGCARTPDTYAGPTPMPGALNVVTTTTLLADMVRQVGGQHVSVLSLVPKGGEVHTFDPRPSEAWALSSARLVFCLLYTSDA